MTNREPMSHAEHAQMARKHVFSVNGSAAFLDFVRELLEGDDYNVTTTNFVPRTIDQIAVLRPDLVIVDLEVGVRAGWDLLATLATHVDTLRIPLIVTSTAQAMLDEAEQLGYAHGERRYLLKPFDIDALERLVRELIGSA
jgi:CheY-like chemotaxis protein